MQFSCNVLKHGLSSDAVFTLKKSGVADVKIPISLAALFDLLKFHTKVSHDAIREIMVGFFAKKVLILISDDIFSTFLPKFQRCFGNTITSDENRIVYLADLCNTLHQLPTTKILSKKWKEASHAPRMRDEPMEFQSFEHWFKSELKPKLPSVHVSLFYMFCKRLSDQNVKEAFVCLNQLESHALSANIKKKHIWLCLDYFVRSKNFKSLERIESHEMIIVAAVYLICVEKEPLLVNRIQKFSDSANIFSEWSQDLHQIVAKTGFTKAPVSRALMIPSLEGLNFDTVEVPVQESKKRKIQESINTSKIPRISDLPIPPSFGDIIALSSIECFDVQPSILQTAVFLEEPREKSVFWISNKPGSTPMVNSIVCVKKFDSLYMLWCSIVGDIFKKVVGKSYLNTLPMTVGNDEFLLMCDINGFKQEDLKTTDGIFQSRLFMPSTITLEKMKSFTEYQKKQFLAIIFFRLVFRIGRSNLSHIIQDDQGCLYSISETDFMGKGGEIFENSEPLPIIRQWIFDYTPDLIHMFKEWLQNLQSGSFCIIGKQILDRHYPQGFEKISSAIKDMCNEKFIKSL